MKIIVRYICLIALSIAIGVICSCLMDTVVIIRGVVLSTCLTIGTIIINSLNAHRLSQNETPKIITSIVIGGICGLIAGCILINIDFMGYIYIINRHYDIMRPRIPVYYYKLATIATCFLYGTLLHWAYARRWQNTSVNMGAGILRISIICGLFRMIAEHPIDAIVSLRDLLSFYRIIFGCLGILIYLMLTSIPFAYLWFIVHLKLDPAWSFERWHEASTNENNR